MEKINYKQMYLYFLKRNREIDKNGRPAILIKYLGEESLIWSGTTQFLKTTKELPLELDISNQKTYFYAKGIQKVNTNSLISYWIDKNNTNIYKLNKRQQEELIQKFSSFTRVKNPYLTIKDLEVKVLLQEEIINQKDKIIEELKIKIQKLEKENTRSK